MQIDSKHFEFLDDLRESGVTNMWGAGPYIQEEFGIIKKEASVIHNAWMATFDGTSLEDRVKAANLKYGEVG